MATPFRAELCDSEFFDPNITWYTEQPQLSPCLRDTLLVWLPACVFLLTLANEYSNIRQARSKGTKTIPWNTYNRIRLLLTIILLVMKLLEAFNYIYIILSRQSYKEVTAPIVNDDASLTRHLLVTSQPTASANVIPSISYNFVDEGKTLVISALLVPVIQLLCYSLLALIYFVQRKVGIHTSGPVWFYLFISVLCTSIDYYSVMFSLRSALFDNIELYVDCTHFPLLFILFIVECRGDTPMVELDGDPNDDGRPIVPEVYASYCSSITFWWYNKFLLFGYRSRLRLVDLWRTLPRDRSSELVPVFCRAWIQKVPRGRARKMSPKYHLANGEAQPANSMMMVLSKLFWGQFLFAASLKFMQDILQYITPLILKLILAFMKSKDSPEWHGILFALLLLIVPTLQSVILGNYFYRMQLIGFHVRAMIMGAVYRKSLLLNGSSRLQSTSGEIVNLMSVDSQRFQDLLVYINLFWSAPLQIILAVFLLYRELGWPIFAGVICMACVLPANAYLARKIKLLQIKVMKTKDERIKHINEIFGGIKVIKLYAWENSFIANLFNYRNRELGFLSRILTLDALQTFLWQCSPFVVACVTFAVYVSVDSNNVLDAEKAFVSISLFNLLRFPLTMLPSLITSLVLTMVSARRLSSFLNSDELVKYVTRNEELEAISIEGGTLAWTSNETETTEGTTIKSMKPILKDIELHVKPRSFVAVVGQVASGKSSLLSAILGEMHRIAGRFNICRSLKLAYVPQQAWIQNMTVKDNILFGSECDEERYEHVLNACSLRSDLATLPGGDQAEIGEKGINLSGGQKQRVSLARACYSQSDIFLLDDPLSALDSHVAKQVFDEVLSSSTGILKNKTRVLATNSLFVLPYVDHIVVLDNGKVVQSGSYQQLMKDEKGHLADFMRQYSVTQKDQVVDDKQAEVEFKVTGLSASLEVPDDRDGAKAKSLAPIKSDVGRLIDAEKVEMGSVSFQVYMEYFKNVSIIWLLAVSVSLIGSSAFNVATNLWLSLWASDAEDPAKSKDTDLRTIRLLVYAIFGGLQCFSVLVGSLALCKGAVRAARRLHLSLLERVMHSPMTFFDTTPIGRMVNRFAKDIDVVDSTLPGTFRGWLNCLLQVLSTLFVICYSFPSFLVLLAPLVIMYMLIQRVFIVATRQLKRLESTTRSPIYSNFNETLLGISTIRAYNCVERFVLYSDNVVDRNQSCAYPNVIANRWLSVRLELFGNLVTTAAALFSVFYKGSVGAGVAGLTISYSLSITQTLSWFVRMTSDLETHIVSVERILEYMQNKQEDKWIKEDSRPPLDWPQTGAIDIRQYSTRYRDHTDLVLHDISIDIKPREKIGIVGRTGSGKSSLSLALFRILEPTSGAILIDNLDLTKYGLHAIRSKLTIIPQDPVLFSGTLRFNLDPLKLYPDIEIWRALDLAHLRPYISTLAEGLDYQVSEYGENFSVGQRQLICLARAILRKSKILILDEATASVDVETDAIVQRTIRDIFKDCTIITIAHRLHTILDSDRILVIESGRVKELDNPMNLIGDENSTFASLVRDAGIDTRSILEMRRRQTASISQQQVD